jgi:hypothetical protein
LELLLLADKSFAEPVDQVTLIHISFCKGDHSVVNSLPLRFDEGIAAALYQQFHKYPGGALVAICERVILDHRVKKRGTLLIYFAIVSRVRACQRRMKPVFIYYTQPSTEENCLSMSSDGVF